MKKKEIKVIVQKGVDRANYISAVRRFFGNKGYRYIRNVASGYCERMRCLQKMLS